MRVTITAEKLKPDTVSGYGVKVSYIYTSFDHKEIEAVEKEASKISNIIIDVKAGSEKMNKSENVNDLKEYAECIDIFKEWALSRKRG